MSCGTFGQVCSQSTTDKNASSILWIHFPQTICVKSPLKVPGKGDVSLKAIGWSNRPVRFVAGSGAKEGFVSRVCSSPWASKVSCSVSQKTSHFDGCWFFPFNKFFCHATSEVNVALTLSFDAGCSHKIAAATSRCLKSPPYHYFIVHHGSDPVVLTTITAALYLQ